MKTGLNPDAALENEKRQRSRLFSSYHNILIVKPLRLGCSHHPLPQVVHVDKCLFIKLSSLLEGEIVEPLLSHAYRPAYVMLTHNTNSAPESVTLYTHTKEGDSVYQQSKP